MSYMIRFGRQVPCSISIKIVLDSPLSDKIRPIRNYFGNDIKGYRVTDIYANDIRFQGHKWYIWPTYIRRKEYQWSIAYDIFITLLSFIVIIHRHTEHEFSWYSRKRKEHIRDISWSYLCFIIIYRIVYFIVE